MNPPFEVSILTRRASFGVALGEFPRVWASVFSLKGCESLAWGNAPGWLAKFVHPERVRQSLSQAFRLKNQAIANLGRCPRLCCASPSG
jgi:hypothetical protein